MCTRCKRCVHTMPHLSEGVHAHAKGNAMAALLAALLGADRSSLYKAGKLLGDYNALKKGKVCKRIGRRVAGSYSGKTMGKMFG